MQVKDEKEYEKGRKIMFDNVRMEEWKVKREKKMARIRKRHCKGEKKEVFYGEEQVEK